MAYVPGDHYEGSIVLSVEGISDTLHGVKKYDFDTHEKIRKKIDEYAKKIKRSAQQNTPVRTGALRKSITAKKYHNGLSAHIFPSDDKIRKAMTNGKRQTYRHFVEYGVGTRYTKYHHPIFGTFRGSYEGRGYMAKARREHGGSFENDMRNIVDRKVVI